MRPTENVTLTTMKEHRISRQIMYLKVKISSAVWPQSIVKDKQFLPTWQKSELCSLDGHMKPLFEFLRC